jgi:uncharacterized protein (TIGR03663 family)
MPRTLSSYSKFKPMSIWLLLIMALLALGLGAWYRLPDLGLRPMHTDEAILGKKFIEMMQSGRFDYDPTDFHGPVLHYLTALVSKAAQWGDAMQVTEAQLRLVPALTGLLLIALTLLLFDALDRLATGLAMLFLAVSPMQVFYSRYFIMEVPFVLLLALFMVACWRFAKSESVLWLLVAGTSLGLLHATKETFIINMLAMGVGWLVAQFFSEGFTDRNRSLFLSLGRDRHLVRMPWVWVGLVAVVVSVATFSGGFRFWDDAGESVTTYFNYAAKSGGADHAKPFYYYLSILLYTQDGPFVWSEAFIAGLAVIGMVHSFTGRYQRAEEKKAFLVFLTGYTLAALLAYSIIPYKTPWTFLSVQYGLVLLAGVGGQVVVRLFKGKLWHLLCTGVFVAGIYHLCSQSMFSIRDRGVANLRGPYVYSHTATPVLKLVKKLRDLAAFKPEAFNAQVINAGQGWPLPWYLRDVPHVGYQGTLPTKLDASVIVIDYELVSKLDAKFGPEFYTRDLDHIYNLRPGVKVWLLVEKGLWESFAAANRPSTPP